MTAEREWKKLGFKQSPYETRPLLPEKAQVALHVGREHESGLFFQQLDSKRGCVVVISGDVGLGKTSFFNCQQYLLHAGHAPVDFKTLINHEPITLGDDYDQRRFAERLVDNIAEAIRAEAGARKTRMPKFAQKTQKWLSHTGSSSGFSVGLDFFGTGANFGNSVQIPPVSEMRAENWIDIVRLMVFEVKRNFGLDGILVCIDNVESVPIENLTRLLMDLRDNLLSVEGVWWVIIGQSKLYTKINAADKRISQRMAGTGVEIKPLSVQELHEVIQRRIRLLRNDSDAVSPISQDMHGLLYSACWGHPRLMLKMAEDLFGAVVSTIRTHIRHEMLSSRGYVDEREVQSSASRVLSERITESGLPEALVADVLRALVVSMLIESLDEARLNLLLDRCCSPVDHDEILDFSSIEGDAYKSALAGLEAADLVYFEERADLSVYRLKGYAWLCNYFNLWDRVRAPFCS